MTEHFGFFDAIQDSNGHYDREYNAQQWNEPFRALVTTGVMKGAYNQLEVTANGANMVSSVKSGIAFIEGRFYFNDALVDLIHDTEVMGLSRIDRIVVRMDSRTEARHVKTFIKKGVPAASPVPPVLTQTQQLYEISLAQIQVVGGQTYIAANAVTDERGKDVICPWAGSKILPNFDNSTLQELIENQYTDGPYAKSYSGDLNNLVESGLYSIPAFTPNAPITSPQLVEVLVSNDGNFMIQKCTGTGSHNDSITLKRTAKKDGGVWKWSTTSPQDAGYLNGWKVENPFLSKSITTDSDLSAATSSAVKRVNDKIDMYILTGYGSPEGSRAAPPGTLHLSSQGGASTTLYVKISGTGNTGWNRVNTIA